MAKYLLAYHGGKMADTPAEQTKVMDAWGAWFGELGPRLKDPGNPVGASRFIGPDGKVTDSNGSNPVSGYSIIEAGSIDEATKLAGGCPVLQAGGSVEVAETFDVM